MEFLSVKQVAEKLGLQKTKSEKCAATVLLIIIQHNINISSSFFVKKDY